MLMLWLGWLRRIALAIAVVVAALGLLSAIWWLWMRLSPPWDSRTIIAIAIVALALLSAIWWLWWRLPQRYVAQLALKIRDPKARADVEDSFRKTVGQALGGAVVLIGAGTAYLQFSQQQQATRDQLRAAHDLLISNQVAKGFEQLGSDKLVVRLGGLYALEGVMNTSEEYYQPVLEAVCAFVREGTIGMTVNRAPTTDIQAALTVIARRARGANGPGPINLSGVNISGVSLRHARLDGADLGSANLNRADLNRAALPYANLSRADLRDADLRGAYLGGANLIGADMVGANLAGADLRGADLSDAILNQNQLAGACGTDAKLPQGFFLRPCS
jgi:hypothetical protein